MIERFPRGLRLTQIDGETMAACADMPFVIFDPAVSLAGGWLTKGVGTTTDPNNATRWTLAEAFFHLFTLGAELRSRAWLQPIDYIRLDLPLPTSVNGLFIESPSRKAHGKGKSRVKTREYKAWIEAAGWALKPQLQAQGAPIKPDVPTFGRHWALWIRLNVDHQGDVTNRVKALEDLLVEWKITVGDQWNDRCVVERDRTLDTECRVIIYRKVQP